MAPNTLAQLQLSEDYVYGLQAISYCSLGLVPPYNGHLLFEGQKVNQNPLFAKGDLPLTCFACLDQDIYRLGALGHLASSFMHALPANIGRTEGQVSTRDYISFFRSIINILLKQARIPSQRP
jgi:hypothetical protein